MVPTTVAAFKCFSLLNTIIQGDDLKLIVPFTYFLIPLQGWKEFSKAESDN
jgi:hypothetical protein